MAVSSVRLPSMSSQVDIDNASVFENLSVRQFKGVDQAFNSAQFHADVTVVDSVDLIEDAAAIGLLGINLDSYITPLARQQTTRSTSSITNLKQLVRLRVVLTLRRLRNGRWIPLKRVRPSSPPKMRL